MQKLILLFSLLVGVALNAQPTSVATLQETARGYIKDGDYENALLVLNRALNLQPNNKDLLKDVLFISYLKKDYAKALEVGKPLVERDDADVQTYQLLGLAYKAIGVFKECEKLYKKGIKKFPASGILYSEYGEILAEKDTDDAMKLWEKGIEADGNYASNYYYVSKFYARSGELLWSILYGEMFLNLESFTKRSNEIKVILLDSYKKFFAMEDFSLTFDNKRSNDFTYLAAQVLNHQRSLAARGVNPETLTAIRTRFILDWYEKYSDKFPFRLFDHERQLLQEGYFEAYNQWLFGAATNNEAYQAWQKNHAEDMNNFLSFIRKKIFKIPAAQQYRKF